MDRKRPGEGNFIDAIESVAYPLGEALAGTIGIAQMVSPVGLISSKERASKGPEGAHFSGGGPERGG